MKYIRTKSNHIYRTLEDFMQSDLPQSKIRVENVHKGWYVVIYKSEIIKEVDAIEELCDECVYKLTKDKYPWLTQVSAIKDFKLLKQFGGTVETNVVYEFIYLAIWTDKGLIYVAKMNEKGDLQLL